MKELISFVILAFLFGTAQAEANISAKLKPDLAAGQQKAAMCAACHGADGNSAAATMPKLAGQQQKYLIKQMNNFKAGAKGGRDNPIMSPLMAGLSEQDIVNLSAYFASQKPQLGSTDPKLLKAGQQLYRGGDKERGIPACSACHGPKGQGNGPADFPAVSGQHTDYTVAQLKQFRDGQRSNDANAVMRDIATKMTDEQIQAVASYMAGLH